MPKKPATIKIKTSAGGVVYRKEQDGIHVILIKLRSGSIYTLPKGTVDTEESLEETALREVKEETGLNGNIQNDLGNITYWYYDRKENAKYKKTVHYFLVEYVSGKTEDHDFEVEDALWFDINDALEKASYRGDKHILQKAMMFLKR